MWHNKRDVLIQGSATFWTAKTKQLWQCLVEGHEIKNYVKLLYVIKEKQEI